ncbi:hypothetical protein P0W64_11915 [Tsukamurella sp. 8F]|uniref:hypothetical protein n=1 Tax=unclassified Tsukamurella TaxID=2633480 RepID=UPI0023B92870|nr:MULTISPECIES: hypothetical protein [unclassified Tsukamurella]MDF0531458.1 hypothetical protein [Tsukamurella sp. 8J]MDF0587479.1 hypothetical protein [Tsukamurella sp. 8F]
MFWKILAAIVVIWLALMILGAIIHHLIPLLVLGLIVVGIVSVVRWFSSADKSKTSV